MELRNGVLDTNVLVSGLISRQGASHHVLRALDAGRFRAAVSTALFLEYEAVLQRPDIRAATGHSAQDVSHFLDAFAHRCVGVNITFRTRPLMADPADEMVFETAFNAGGCPIITHNARDFLPATSWGISVITPNVWLKEFLS